jgi:hypothetical protein
MLPETFSPIPDPLSLSPADFVAEARRRGLTLHRATSWSEEYRTGDIDEIAAILAGLDLGKVPNLYRVQDVLRINTLWHRGLVAGFQGNKRVFGIGERPDYDRGYDYGRTVYEVAFSATEVVC